MQHITQYDGLYGEATAERNPADGEYLFSELLQTRSPAFNWVIQPHIHARLFQVFLVETGAVEFLEASGKRQLATPVVLLIPPTALHGLSYTPDATGRILTLSDSLVESLFPGTNGSASTGSALAPMLGSIQQLATFAEPNTLERVRALMTEIDEELFDNQSEKRLMLHASLQRLFLIFFRLWQQTEAVGAVPTSAATQYFRKFQQRVRQAGTTHSIAQLADELAITPVHLNRVCRSIAGKSASELVQEHILNEARKYLTYTSYSVSEIAYLLHFEYPNYFARFFKKHTGLSPTEFREGLPA